MFQLILILDQKNPSQQFFSSSPQRNGTPCRSENPIFANQNGQIKFGDLNLG